MKTGANVEIHDVADELEKHAEDRFATFHIEKNCRVVVRQFDKGRGDGSNSFRKIIITPVLTTYDLYVKRAGACTSRVIDVTQKTITSYILLDNKLVELEGLSAWDRPFDAVGVVSMHGDADISTTSTANRTRILAQINELTKQIDKLKAMV